MLIAPSVLFFAATGLLQIYSLHEDHTGYTPLSLIENLSAVHKDQRFGTGHREPAGVERPQSVKPASAAPRIDAVRHAAKIRKFNVATSLLKAVFASVAVGLILSTILGLWIAIQNVTRRRTHLVLLSIGAIVPLILAALTA